MINGGYPETPDALIERTPEDSLPDPADCCPVCGTYQDCMCPDDAEDAQRPNPLGDSWRNDPYNYAI